MATLRPLGLWLVAVAGAASPAVAAAAPTQPGELINPLFDPGNCVFCHLFPNALVQAADPPYAPLRTWQGSLMANSARDPVFWAGVAVADQDVPGGTELCIRCHAPRAFLQEHGDVTTFDQLTPEEEQGVECMLCHRMMEDPEVTEPGNARYTLDDVLVGANVPRRGPWDFSDGIPEPPHSYINDPFTGTSRLCGTCHDVTTERERVDDDGVGIGVPFNEQRTYREWLNSDFATGGPAFASCQDCHMPAVVDMPGCIQHANNYAHATGGRRHDLVGANRFMVELLLQEYGSAGANVISDQFFETTLESMDAFLPTAATLAVEGPDDVDLTTGLAGLQVTVTNNTGHKLPTGYSEGRVMWLEVVAEYGGQVVASSGAWDQTTGMQQDVQLRTYEAIGEDYADGTTFHLLRNNHWLLDSRIPPLGLQPDIETDPVGDRYTPLADGSWPNFDVHTYAFQDTADVFDVTPSDATDDVLTVTVRLRYVINTAAYIEFLGDEGLAAGADVATLFDLAGGSPALTITEQVLAVPIVGFGAVGGSSSGGAGSSSGSPTSSGADTAGQTTTTAGAALDSTTAASAASGGSTADVGTGDPGAAADDDGGCSCRSEGGSPSSEWLMLPLLALGRRRSGRRRSVRQR